MKYFKRPNQPLPSPQTSFLNSNVDQTSYQVPASPTLNISINNRLSNNISTDASNVILTIVYFFIYLKKNHEL